LLFAGVRKVVLCVDPDRRPGDGTEVSYTEMELRSEEAVRKLVAGEPLAVTIAADFRPEEMPANGEQPKGPAQPSLSRTKSKK